MYTCLLYTSQGLNKYDAIYGIPLEREIKARVPELGSARFLFLHDIEAFALGESWYGNCRDVDKILCVCIGTGAGSAFVENGKTVKTGKGVPENGWIYQQPFGDSILDDYLSVRGLEQISLAVTGKEMCIRDSAQISTIHGFCSYVIKNYFQMIDLDPVYRMADEGEIRLMKSDVIQKVMEERFAEKDPAFTRFVESYAAGKQDDGLDALVLRCV